MIHGLKQPNVQTEALFTDRRWRLVRSFAPRQSWLAVLGKNGFQCSRESKLLDSMDPATDLIEIGQYADASREQLLALTLWLAPSLWSCRDDDATMADLVPPRYPPSLPLPPFSCSAGQWTTEQAKLSNVTGFAGYFNCNQQG